MIHDKVIVFCINHLHIPPTYMATFKSWFDYRSHLVVQLLLLNTSMISMTMNLLPLLDSMFHLVYRTWGRSFGR